MQSSLFDLRPPALTISAITAHLRQLLENDAILQDIWIEGEISNWSPASSGHIYFTLKDAGASIRCVIWRSTALRLGYRPRGNGEAILAHGRVSVYEAGGAYQFYVDEVEPAGLGALYVQFERLKRQLAAEGLFDAERKRPLPAFPLRIGVVTSIRAAALKDILNVLSRRCPLAEVIIASTAVQGEEAPPQIIAALKLLAALTPPVDVILLARGGGSIEDLWAFNDERVARAIAACPVPVVSGVGHETDFTIADFVADQRAPTPSAAAEMITVDVEELGRMVEGYRYQLTVAAADGVAQLKAELQVAQNRLKRLSPQAQMDSRRQQIDDRLVMMGRVLRHRLNLKREQTSGAQARLTALNPKATLARGYAIVQKAGQTVVSVGQIAAGQAISVILSDGSFEAEVK